ncbi:putative Ufm1-specific protease, partial [Stegodyphus mimosarum]
MELIQNPHIGVLTPSETIDYKLIRGSYLYYHYFCDGINDSGWGCGYRTLQTICSWITKQQNDNNLHASVLAKVPSIAEIQKILVEIGDKAADFQGSHQWIGSVEVSYCLEYLYKVQCRIIHARSTGDLKKQIKNIFDHFQEYG